MGQIFFMTSHAMISVRLSLDGCIIVNTKNMVILIMLKGLTFSNVNLSNKQLVRKFTGVGTWLVALFKNSFYSNCYFSYSNFFLPFLLYFYQHEFYVIHCKLLFNFQRPCPLRILRYISFP